MATSTTREILKAIARRSPDRRRDLITTLYGLALVICMVVAVMLHGVTVSVQPRLTSSTLALGTALALTGVLLRTSRALGPASLSPAPTRWLAPTPLTRAELLQPRWRVTQLLLAALGALFGVTAGLLGGVEVSTAMFGGLAGLAVGSACAYVALEAQARNTHVRTAPHLLVVFGVAVIAAAVFGARVVNSPALGLVTCAATAASLGLIARGAVKSSSWLSAVNLASLRQSGERTCAWLDAAVSLNTDGAAARSELLRARRRGGFRSVSAPSSNPYVALLRHDVRYLQRNARAVGVRLAACLGTVLVDRLFGSTVSAVWLALSLLALATALTPRLRTWLESTSLWRSLPHHPRAVSWTLTAVPLSIVLVVGVTTGALTGNVWAGSALALAALAPALRRHRRPAMQLGQVLDTPFGQVPLGIVMALTYGFESVGSTALSGLLSNWAIAVAVGASWLLHSLWRAWPTGSYR